MHAQSLNRVWRFATQWTVVCQAPLSVGFSRPDYWGGLPFPPPGDLPDQDRWIFFCHWATKKGYPTVYIHLIWQPTAIFLPGKFRGQRSLVGDSPWSHKESTRLSDFTKDLLVVITMGTGILKMNTWSQNSIYSFSPDLGEPLHQHRTAGFLIKAIVGGEGWGQICTKSLTSSLRIAISGQLN